MQKSQTYSEIIDPIQTVEDLNKLKSDLTLLQESLYLTKPNLSISASLFKKFEKAQDKKEFINLLINELTTIKVLEITISFEISARLLEKINSWLTNHIKEKVVLKINIDQSIMGGAIFSFNGKFFDDCLKTKLNNTLKNYV